MTQPSWLNQPVFGFGVWPNQEIEVSINDVEFTLRPQTISSQASIHLNLAAQNLELNEANSLINKLLSLMCFCSDQPYWLGSNGLSGTVTKQSCFPKEQLRPFNRRIDKFPETLYLLDNTDHLISLALYREGKISSIYSHALACLSFFKIIEPLKENKGPETLNDWMKPHLKALEHIYPSGMKVLKEKASDKNMPLSEYLFKHIRNGAAHLFLDTKINLDEMHDSEAFYFAMYPLEYMARNYIEEDLKVPTLLDWYKLSRN